MTTTTTTTTAHSTTGAPLLRIAVGSTNPAKIRAVEQALQQILVTRRNHLSKDDDGAGLSASEEAASGESRPGWHIQGFEVPSGVPDQPWGDEETRQGAQNRARAAYVAYKKATGTFPHLALGLEGGLEWSGGGTPPSALLLLSTAEGTSSLGQEPKGPASGPGADFSSKRSNRAEKARKGRDDNHVGSNHNHNNAATTNHTFSSSLYCMAWMAVYGRRQAITVDLLASADTSSYFGDKKPVFGLAKTASFALPSRVAELVLHQGLELSQADDLVFQRVQSKHGSGTVGILTDQLIDRSSYYQPALILALIPWIRPDLYPHGTTTSCSI